MASSSLWLAFEKFFTLPALAPGLMILLSTVFARQAWKTLPVKYEKSRSDIRAVSLIILVFGLIDWLLIALLPHLNISYAPLATTLFLVLLARLAAFICLGMVWDIGRRFWLAFLKH